MGSGFQALDSSLCQWNFDSGSPAIVSGIPDSMCVIPDSKAEDSGFSKQNFPGYCLPQAKIFQIPESGLPLITSPLKTFKAYVAIWTDKMCH